MRTSVALGLVLFVTACKSSAPPPAPAPIAESAPAAQTTTRSAAAGTAVAAAPAPAELPNANANVEAKADPKKPLAWTDQVTLTGRLVKKDVLSARGGTIKTTFLILDEPISVEDTPGAAPAETFGSYEAERELWYAGATDTASLLGERVTYRGPLNPMQTGHHHSNVWLSGDLTLATK